MEAGVVERRILCGHRRQLGLGHAAPGIAVPHVDRLCDGHGQARALGSRRGSPAVVHWRRVVGNGCLGPLLRGNFTGNVGPAQSTDVDVQAVANPFAEQADAIVGYVDALDAADATGKGQDLAADLIADIVDELVRKVEDENRRIRDGVNEGGVGDDVAWEGDAGEVFDVFVVFVDDVSQLLRSLADGLVVVLGAFGDGDILLIHPHLDILLKDIFVRSCVFGNDFCNGGSPVARIKPISFLFFLT